MLYAACIRVFYIGARQLNVSGKKYKLIDLFAGAGGLSNGFQQTGKFEVVGAVEINKEAIETYIYNHQNNKKIIITPPDCEVSNISTIDFKEFMEQNGIDNMETVVIGGPPCQGFSNANRQKNYLISGNNQLVKEYARAIDEVRPIALLMENVKTMNSVTHKFFVTKHIENSIYAYSSEQHLRTINDEIIPFWEEDYIVLLETTKTEYRDLINRIINMKDFKPIITNEIELSRMRSVVRKLKKEKKYSPILSNDKKELSEIKKIIESLVKYDSGELNAEEEFKKVINVTIHSFMEIEKKSIVDNEKILNNLQGFIEINQLLRYLKEIRDENIVMLGNLK